LQNAGPAISAEVKPMAKLAVCTERGCPNLVAGGGRCRIHARARYISAPDWPAVRMAQLQRQPFCHCGAIAVDVDHVNGREAGDGPDNLQSLCRSHHAQKTATHDGGFGLPRRRQW
jgi:5-methylcytosine-specific restriction endonuclease McrA